MTPIALTIAGSDSSGGGGHHCGTGQGVGLVAAIEPAKRYITRAIETCPSPGSVGPVNHNAQARCSPALNERSAGKALIPCKPPTRALGKPLGVFEGA